MKRSHKYSLSDLEEGEIRPTHKKVKKHHKKKSHKREKEREHKKKSAKKDFKGPHKIFRGEPFDHRNAPNVIGPTNDLPFAPATSQEEFKESSDACITNNNAANAQMLIDVLNKLPAIIENSKNINDTQPPENANAWQIQKSCTIKSSNDGSFLIKFNTNENFFEGTSNMNQNKKCQNLPVNIANSVSKTKTMTITKAFAISLENPAVATNFERKSEGSHFQQCGSNPSFPLNPVELLSSKEQHTSKTSKKLTDYSKIKSATKIDKIPPSATITSRTLPAFSENEVNMNDYNISEKPSLIIDPRQENIFTNKFWDDIPQKQNFENKLNPDKEEKINEIASVVHASQASCNNSCTAAVSKLILDNLNFSENKSQINFKDAKLSSVLDVCSGKNPTKKNLNIFEGPYYVYKEETPQEKKESDESPHSVIEIGSQNTTKKTNVTKPFTEKNTFFMKETLAAPFSNTSNSSLANYSSNSSAVTTYPIVNVLQQDFSIPPPPIIFHIGTNPNTIIQQKCSISPSPMCTTFATTSIQPYAQLDNFNVQKSQLVNDKCNIFEMPVPMTFIKEKSSPINVENKPLCNISFEKNNKECNIFNQQISSPNHQRLKIEVTHVDVPGEKASSFYLNHDLHSSNYNNSEISKNCPRDIKNPFNSTTSQNSPPMYSPDFHTSDLKLNSGNMKISSAKELHIFLPVEKSESNITSNKTNDLSQTSNNYKDWKIQKMSENLLEQKNVLKKKVHSDVSDSQEVKKMQIATKNLETKQGPINDVKYESPRSKNDERAFKKSDEDLRESTTEVGKIQTPVQKQKDTRKKIFEAWKNSQIMSPATSVKTYAPKSVLQNVISHCSDVKNSTSQNSTLQIKQKEKPLAVEPSTCIDILATPTTVQGTNRNSSPSCRSYTTNVNTDSLSLKQEKMVSSSKKCKTAASSSKLKNINESQKNESNSKVDLLDSKTKRKLLPLKTTTNVINAKKVTSKKKCVIAEKVVTAKCMTRSQTKLCDDDAICSSPNKSAINMPVKDSKSDAGKNIKSISQIKTSYDFNRKQNRMQGKSPLLQEETNSEIDIVSNVETSNLVSPCPITCDQHLKLAILLTASPVKTKAALKYFPSDHVE